MCGGHAGQMCEGQAGLALQVAGLVAGPLLAVDDTGRVVGQVADLVHDRALLR